MREAVITLMRPKPSNNKMSILVAAIVVLALAARLLPGARTIDDAYITYRYAQNLIAGNGLVYNPGEAVLGTTTPLYAGLLALTGLFFGGVDAPFPAISLVINALADAATCLLLFRLGRTLKVSLAGSAAALAWAILPYSVTFAIGGLETSVFVFLLTALAIAHLEERRRLAALLAALSFLTRPDAALLLLPIGADRLYLAMRKGDQPSWQEFAAAGLPLAAWLIPATLFYGSPIPNSIAAKTGAYALHPNAAFIRFLQHYATPFMENLTFGSTGIAVGLVLYLFLAVTGAFRLVRLNPRAWPWVAFPWLWLAAYSIANPLIFRWYLTPPLAAYLFTVLAGLDFIRRDLQSGPLKRLPAFVPGVLVLLPLTLLPAGWTRTPDHGPSRPAPEMAWILLELKYREAADYLQPVFAEHPGSPTLAAGDIGALGYYTDARILDTLGLVSPESIPYYPTRPEYHVNAYAVAPELILDLQPDYIVLLEVYGREGLFKRQAFNDQYELVHVVETDIYDSLGMLIYARR